MHSNKPTRRKLLGAVTGSIVLAGCLGDDSDDVEGDNPGEQNGEESDSGDESGTGDTGDQNGDEPDDTGDQNGTDDETGTDTDSESENGSEEGDGDDGTGADQNGTGSDDTGTENGGESNQSESDEDSVSEDEESGSETVVQVTNTDEYGEILVGPDGYSLYMFDADERGAGESACYDGCANNWPPLTVEGEPSTGPDVEAALATFERENGSRQVTANGWPLYYWANDESPGETTGQGVNEVWWVLDSGGNPVRSSGEDTPSEDDEAENGDAGDGDGGSENGDSGSDSGDEDDGDDSDTGDDDDGGYGGGYDY